MDNQVFLGRNLMPKSEYSEEMATRIDEEVRGIALRSFERAKTILRENRSLMDRLVDALLEQETMDGEQFRQIVREYTQIPKDQLTGVGATS
jgi:cell division protease FtsH